MSIKDYREYNCTTKKDVNQAFKDLAESVDMFDFSKGFEGEFDLRIAIDELEDIQNEIGEVINIIGMYLERKGERK